MEIREKIFALFEQVLKITPAELNEEISVGDHRNWDSLGHNMLISALEKAFECEFDIDETLEMESVGDIIEILEERFEKNEPTVHSTPSFA